jgi:hypothetical protein
MHRMTRSSCGSLGKCGPATRCGTSVATASVSAISFGNRLSPDQRHLEPDPTEQAALAEIGNLRQQGHSLRGIAAALNSRGHRTRRGTEWRLESVNRIVKQFAPPAHAKIA